MAVSTPNLYPVRLTDAQRVSLRALTAAGRAPAAKVRHAHVLLLADKGRDGGPYTDPQIADALGMHVNTVARVRKRFATAGEAPALDRRPRPAPAVPPKVDGRLEAHLVALCCGGPPDGHARWSLRLLAREAVARGFVTAICAETVRRALKKTRCSPGGSGAGACPSGTGRGSSPRWSRSSTPTAPRPTRRPR